MSANEMVFLFFIGIMYSIAFWLTKNILILWPIFQPMGQLVTLINDRLVLPPLAALGFIEALIVMFVLVWLANRYAKKHGESVVSAELYVMQNGFTKNFQLVENGINRVVEGIDSLYSAQGYCGEIDMVISAK